MAKARSKAVPRILSLEAAYDQVGNVSPPVSRHAFREMAQRRLIPGQLPGRGRGNAHLIDASTFAARSVDWASEAHKKLSKVRSTDVGARKNGLTTPGRSSHVRRQRRAHVKGAAKRFLEGPNRNQMRAVIELLFLVPASDDARITITIAGDGEPVVYRASRKEAWAEYDRAKLRGPCLDDEIIFG